MRWMLAIACVAGCGYAPSRIALDGDASSADGPEVDGPPGDPDNDGVPNPLDNCPSVANSNQHDEDNDNTGDACDPCPQLAGAVADADGDGDGIGDGCDPRPALAGDELQRFESFAEGSGLPSGWTSIVGTAANWTILDDAMVTQVRETTHQVMLDIGAGSHSVDIGIEVTAVNAVNDTIGMGAVIDGDGTQSNFYMCFVQTVTTAQFTQLFGPGTIALAASASPPTLPGRYRIATYYDGAVLRCRFGGAGAPGDLTTTQPPLGNTHVGIRMRNAAVKVEYVAIYRSL